MGSFWGVCFEETCPKHEKPEFAEKQAWFGHYYRKGRNTLIRLIQDQGFLRNAYIEPTYILADMLARNSRIEETDEEEY